MRCFWVTVKDAGVGVCENVRRGLQVVGKKKGVSGELSRLFRLDDSRSVDDVLSGADQLREGVLCGK